jgi:hypothetical protein
VKAKEGIQLDWFDSIGYNPSSLTQMLTAPSGSTVPMRVWISFAIGSDEMVELRTIHPTISSQLVDISVGISQELRAFLKEQNPRRALAKIVTRQERGRGPVLVDLVPGWATGVEHNTLSLVGIHLLSIGK